MPKLIQCLTIMTLIVYFAGCQITVSDNPFKANQESETNSEQENQLSKFVGTWQGEYSGIQDEIVIEAGSSETELTIHLHTGFTNAPTVVGKIEGENLLVVEEQEISGMPGSAKLMLDGGRLKLEQSGMGMTIRGEYTRTESEPNAEQNETGADKALPSDIPTDIPMYPDAKVTMVLGDKIKTIRMETFDSAKQICEFYRSKLTSAGWEITNQARLNIQAIKKGESSRIVSVDLIEPTNPAAIAPVQVALSYQ